MTEATHEKQQTRMLQEIQEQPQALRRTLSHGRDAVQHVASEVKKRNIQFIVLAARGTSDHAALYGQYLFHYVNSIPVALATPSLYTLYGASLRLDHALVIGISQSGESSDVVEVVAQARQAGALTIGITNSERSSLATTAEYPLLCYADQERSVAATKTYTTTCTALAMLSASLSGGEVLRNCIEHIPDMVAAALQSEERIAQVAVRYVYARDCVVLGRAFQYSTARETALKLEETCYIVATPFSSADFRHGPAALVEQGRPVILFAPPGKTSDDSLALLQWLRQRGADSLVIAEEERMLAQATVPIGLTLPSLGNEAIPLSTETRIDELLAPFAYIIPGQLLAQHVALHKGLDPDSPRSLTKVTRTM